MEIKTLNGLNTEQKFAIMQLWNREYPESLAYSEIAGFEKYLDGLKNQKHFLAVEGEQILGWAFQFLRDAEIWFAIIVDHAHQKKGIGNALMIKVKQNNNQLSGWVIDNDEMLKSNKKKYLSPLPFYIKNGFSVITEIRLETEKLSAVKIHWAKTHT